MELRLWQGCLVAVSALGILCKVAWADLGAVEISVNYSYSKSNYANFGYNWTRTWEASLGYQLLSFGEVSLSYQSIVDRTHINNYQDTQFDDKIYSVNYQQFLLGKMFPIQPYVKVGVGQLNRDAVGTYVWGVTQTASLDRVTGIIGAGVKVALTRRLGLGAEIQSYLAGGAISTYKDNVTSKFGISFYF